jgi:PadR family transcriptional regulator, regulatory protein PadR
MTGVWRPELSFEVQILTLTDLARRANGQRRPEATFIFNWTFISIYVDFSLMNSGRKFSEQTLALFAVLIEQPRKWRHGYDLSRDTGLKSGTLYPILMRLCDRGLLQSKWEAPSEPGRPPRHIYRLTATGAELAKEQVTVSSNPGSLNDTVGNHA